MLGRLVPVTTPETSGAPPEPSTTTASTGSATPPRRLHRVREVDPTRRGLVLAWLAFTVTFGLLRLLTWLIRIDVGGFGNVEAGGVHLHHYVWGILILLVVGALGLLDRSPRWYGWMGVGYGVGAALVIDEAALLIDLRDVYWDSRGMISVGAALLIIGVVGTLLALTRPTEAERAEHEAAQDSGP